MTELTKEHLDKALDTQTKELKVHTEQEISQLAGMVQRRFDDLDLKLDVKEDVQKLKSQMQEVRQAVGLRR